MSARIVVEEGVEIPDLVNGVGVVVRPGLDVSVRLSYAPGDGQAALGFLASALHEARQAVEANP